MRTWDRLLVIVFLAVLVMPGAGLLAGVGQSSGDDEHRELAAAPEAPRDWQTLRALPDAFSRYFEDHFAFRGHLVRAQAVLRFFALGSTPSPDVIAGRDGWFFYAADGALEDYTAAAPLSESDKAVWGRTLQDVQDGLARQGIRFVFVIVPDKHQIYPEMMPAAVRRIGGQPRAEALVDYLRLHSEVHVLDLRPALLAAKRDERIYHRTDTHWNDRGAFAAYQEIMRSLGLTPDRRSEFRESATQTPGMDLAATLAMRGRVGEDNLRLTPERARRARVVEPAYPNAFGEDARIVTEVNDPSLPRAVIFRDSFANALIPFLSEHFSRAVYLWEYDVDPAVIAAEKPDVVIMEVVGRRVGPFLPYDAFAKADADRAGVDTTSAAGTVERVDAEAGVSSSGEVRR